MLFIIMGIVFVLAGIMSKGIQKNTGVHVLHFLYIPMIIIFINISPEVLIPC